MGALQRLRDFIVEQKIRFDWGSQFIAYMNFMLLIIVASDKIRSLFPFHIGTNTLLIAGIPIAFFFTWLFGYFLDVVVRFPQQQMRTVERRSPAMQDIIERLDRIERKQRKKKISVP